ncbi:MAG: choice-of-anchor Q domain-containing protein [Kiritimatiellae bacterium]|nr:choice-of-anchor Q domain-containing protein [Kiritimatiellia bacterium]
MKNKVHILVLSMMLLAEAALADTHYVIKNNAGAASPFTDWTTAASNIQQAIDDDQCEADDTVLVASGVYDTGAQVAAGGSVSNRVVIWKAITVRASSTNWADTVIKGQWHSPVTANGTNAVRCVYITNGASLIGFTMTNGATMLAGALNFNGGGVYGSGGNGLISNCLIIGNNAKNNGGGIAYAVARNCTIEANSAVNGGGIGGLSATEYAKAYDCTMTRNTAQNYGGGAYYTTISNCTISMNSATGGGCYGGGVFGGSLTEAGNSCWNSIIIANSSRESAGGGYRMRFYNCLVVSNYSSVLGYGGGLYKAVAANCTIVSNRVHGYYTTGQPRGHGGGIAIMSATNCIILGNWDSYSHAETNNYYDSTLAYCCTTSTNDPPGYGAGISGEGNVTNDAAFANFTGGDYRLTPDSPCINKGFNQGWMDTALDMDGRRRIIEGTVDIGAFEFLHRGMVFTGR